MKAFTNRYFKLETHVVVAIGLGFLLTGAAIGEMWERAAPGNWLHPVANASQSGGPAPAIAKASLDFVTLAKTLKPVVVNISTKQSAEASDPGSASPFGEQGPGAEFWRRFFGNRLPQERSPERSLGSGFIIDKQGFILTNNHVVEKADEILVKLSDESEFKAKVVGNDPKTDIALIKIDAKRELPAAPLGDSDTLEVGEWIVAIGNPFGLDNTVTSGIISAKGRHIGAGPYDNFIQTDASINPGNSGGPLINLHGEVVGINTAIYSETGGSIGIGFAIPINLAKQLLPQLKDRGKVTRGFMGVSIQRVTPAIANSLGLKEAQGALIADITAKGPADIAGMKSGDVIVTFDGKEIKDANDLPILVANTALGKTARVKVIRDGKELVLAVTISELKDETVVASVPAKEKLGLTLQNITPEIAQRLGLDRSTGVIVTGVAPGSPADDAGLEQGDVIVEVNRKSVRNLKEYQQAIENGGKPSILFLVRRGENSIFLALKKSE